VVHGLLDKLGIQAELLTRGKLAEMDSVSEPLSDAAKQKLHDSLLNTYKLFVSKVASARKKTYDQIDQIAQGRVWMGTQAQQNGLVDQLGGLDQAIATIRQRAHLPPTGETNLVMYPPRRSLLEMLANSSPEGMEEMTAERKLHEALPVLPNPALWKGGLLRIMPYQFSIH
jgi:protease-4